MEMNLPYVYDRTRKCLKRTDGKPLTMRQMRIWKNVDKEIRREFNPSRSTPQELGRLLNEKLHTAGFYQEDVQILADARLPEFKARVKQRFAELVEEMYQDADLPEDRELLIEQMTPFYRKAHDEVLATFWDVE